MKGVWVSIKVVSELLVHPEKYEAAEFNHQERLPVNEQHQLQVGKEKARQQSQQLAGCDLEGEACSRF